MFVNLRRAFGAEGPVHSARSADAAGKLHRSFAQN